MSFLMGKAMSNRANKGMALISLLTARMRSDGITVSKLARRFAISQGYLSQMLSGKRSISIVKDSVLRECAAYLRLPAISCFLLAGKLQSEDFFSAPDEFSSTLKSALKTVSESQQCQDVAVEFEQLMELPAPVQHLVVLLYESAIGTELMPGRVDWNSISSAGKHRLPFDVRVVRAK